MDKEDVLLGEGLLAHCALVGPRWVQKFLHGEVGPLSEG